MSILYIGVCLFILKKKKVYIQLSRVDIYLYSVMFYNLYIKCLFDCTPCFEENIFVKGRAVLFIVRCLLLVKFSLLFFSLVIPFLTTDHSCLLYKLKLHSKTWQSSAGQRPLHCLAHHHAPGSGNERTVQFIAPCLQELCRFLFSQFSFFDHICMSVLLCFIYWVFIFDSCTYILWVQFTRTLIDQKRLQ